MFGETKSKLGYGARTYQQTVDDFELNFHCNTYSPFLQVVVANRPITPRDSRALNLLDRKMCDDFSTINLSSYSLVYSPIARAYTCTP